MFYILIQKKQLRDELEKALSSCHGASPKWLDVTRNDWLMEMINSKAQALVVEENVLSKKLDNWIEVLGLLSSQIPVLIISEQENKVSFPIFSQSQLISWLLKPSGEDIVSMLEKFEIVSRKMKKPEEHPRVIPIYNPFFAQQLLHQDSALSMILIDSSSYRKVAMSYGSEAYEILQRFFYHLLLELWGVSGSFRKADHLCQLAPHSNLFYILLDQSRASGGIPPPGALERLTDRIQLNIQNRLLAEFFKDPKERALPDYLDQIPDVQIGYASTIYNPCREGQDVLGELIEVSKEVSKIQLSRYRFRKREFIQNLIRKEGILHPKYQAVFETKKLTEKDIEKSHKEKSIAPLKKAIYGFESLIRVNARLLKEILDANASLTIAAEHLKPDNLFTMAASVQLTLELDQACIYVATHNYGDLPGNLLVNILPRNLYYIEALKKLIPDSSKVFFEVAESEAIKNYGLLLQLREKLSPTEFRIAIDDFGKGYAGLDRLIRIKPNLIKLDRCLIEDIHQDPLKQDLVRSIVEMGQKTNSLILAEGIETQEELDTIRKLNIDLVQGFFFHRPEEASSLRSQLFPKKNQK